MSRSVQYSRNCKFPNKAGFKWWMGVVAVLLVVILAVLIYLGGETGLVGGDVEDGIQGLFLRELGNKEAGPKNVGLFFGRR